MKTIFRLGGRALIPLLASFLAAAVLAACPSGPEPGGDDAADTGISWSPAPAASTSLAADSRWEEETVFYHVWVKAFANASGDGSTAAGTVTSGAVGNFDGIRGKLDELEALGVTGIWLSPIFDCAYKGSSTTDNMHGYDTVDYRAVNPLFGTKEDLCELLAAAHERGIRVIFDFVPNHSSSSHPWFLASVTPSSSKRGWYSWRESDPGWVNWSGSHTWHRHWDSGDYFYGVFWDGMPDLNYGNAEVRAEMARIMGEWLDFGFDGARIDAIPYLFEDAETKEWQHLDRTHAYWQSLRETVLDPFSSSGYAKMMIGESWTGRDLAASYGPDDGIPEFHMNFDFSFRDAVDQAVMDASPDALASRMEDLCDGMEEGYRMAAFLSNHDEAGDRPMTAWESAAKVVAGASAMILGAGPSFIYYGNEIGQEDGGMDGDIRHRLPLSWTAWDAQASDPDSILSWHKAFLAAKKAHPALRTGSFGRVSASGDSVLAYLRKSGANQVLVVTNFGAAAASRSLGLSAATDYAGEVSVIIGDAAQTGDAVSGGVLSVNNLPSMATRVIVLSPGATVIRDSD